MSENASGGQSPAQSSKQRTVTEPSTDRSQTPTADGSGAVSSTSEDRGRASTVNAKPAPSPGRESGRVVVAKEVQQPRKSEVKKDPLPNTVTKSGKAPGVLKASKTPGVPRASKAPGEAKSCKDAAKRQVDAKSAGVKRGTSLVNLNADSVAPKEDRTPFDMVKTDATYLEWLELEGRAFHGRYHRERHTVAKNKYNIVRVLGQGGFGLVLLVNVEKGGPLYAMKVMSKEKIKEKKMIKYIIGERRALSAVHHPLIMGLIDKLKDNSNVYIIMPFIECGDLFRLMLSTRLKRFSYEETKFYVAQVFLAFEYLHKMRVVYRDLKPENLMLDRSGYIQLADLGFAKLLDPNRERTYSTLGTPDYMAPEIFAAKNCGYSYSVDWWTTGCLLYEFMVGFPPFHTPDGNTMNVIKKIMSAEIQFPSFIKPDARDLITCLNQKNPHKRLGCQKTGASAIREHAFFQEIDFVRVFHRQLPAPHKPTSKDDKTFYTGRPVPKNVIKISKTMRFNTMFEDF